jgi:hypothetical protein
MKGKRKKEALIRLRVAAELRKRLEAIAEADPRGELTLTDVCTRALMRFADDEILSIAQGDVRRKVASKKNGATALRNRSGGSHE